MYKSLKRIVLLLALVCVTLGLSAFALACNPKPDDNNGPEISAEYQALYEQYKEAAGENAKTLQDWYDALSADIEEIGDIGDITDMDVLEIENVKYVALTYENGRLFLEELLNGESFREYSVFTLSPNNAADESTITGIYLDVNRKGADGALEKVRSVRTGTDGKANVYLEVGQLTYVITVGAQSADSYGFAPGYEPEFSGSQETKTVTFGVQTASQKVTYAAKVVYRAEDNAPTKDVKLSLRYVESDPASLKVVGEGTTGDDGKAAISFYAHEGSEYEFVLDESSLTPDKYEPVKGPIKVNPANEETLFTLIRLKWYSDPVSPTATVTPTTEAASLHNDCDIEVITIPSAGEVESLLTLDEGTHTYKYNSKQVYVAMDYLLERVHAEKTIKQLLENGGFFTFEKCVNEDQNEYKKYDYSELLNAYMEHLTNGIYPLNEDLYSFITAAAENGLFAYKTPGGKYDVFIPLVAYSSPKLIAGKEYSASIKDVKGAYQWGDSNKTAVPYITIPVKSDLAEGYYKLHIHSDKFDDTTTTYHNDYARLGGFTRDKYGDCYISRNFALNKVATTGGSGYDCEGVVYIGANVKEIVLFNSSTMGSTGGNNTFNLKLSLTKITTQNATVVKDNVALLANAKQEFLTSDKSEYQVLVYPETSIWEQHTNATNTNEKTYLKNFTNISTFGYSFGLNRLGVNYTITPTVGSIQGLKIHKYNIQNPNSDKATVGAGKGLPSVTYTPGTAITGSTTNVSVTTGDRSGTSNGPITWGVLFTHSGTGIKTMKIKVEAKNTKYTVTYTAGEGVGKDYVEGGSVYTATKYYTKGTQATVLDNTNVSLNFSKKDYIFNGWSYQNDAGETVIVQPGDKVTMPEHDLVLTAVWRGVKVNSTEPLAAGASVEVDFDSGTYSSIEINLADTLEANKAYTLTMSTGAYEWNLNMAFGDYTIDPYATESTETAHSYVAYFVNVGETHKIVIDILKVDVNFKATIALAEYTPVQLKADGSEILVPVNMYDLERPSGVAAGEVKTNGLYVTFDASMPVPASYTVTKVDSTEISGSVFVIGDLIAGDDDAEGGAKVSGSIGASSSADHIDVKLAEGLTKLHFYFQRASYTHFGVLKIKIERKYSITYEIAEEDRTNKAITAETPTDDRLYKVGEIAQLKNIVSSTEKTGAYEFTHWVKKGDNSGTTYKGSSTYTVTAEDVTFVAAWRIISPFEKSGEFGGGTSGMTTPVKIDGIVIDADTYTSFSITLSKVFKSKSLGLTLKMDLKKSDFAGSITLSADRCSSVLTHSDELSSADHNVFVGFWRGVTADEVITGATITLTLNLDSWKSAGKPKIEDISFEAVQTPNSVDFENKDGKLQATGGTTRGTGVEDVAFKFQLPTTNSEIMNGHTYTVHVKFDKSVKPSGASIIDYYSGSGVTGKATSMTKVTDNEYKYEGWSTDSGKRYLAIRTTDSYMCNVWLEQTDKEDGHLSLEQELTGIKVNNSAPTVVYIDNSHIKAHQGDNDTYYNLTVTGATAPVEVNYIASMTSTSPTTKTFDAQTTLAKMVYFNHIKLTLTTDSSTEQTVNIKLTKYTPVELKDGDNEFSLGADKAVIDLTTQLVGSHYCVTVTQKDGSELPEGTVINLRWTPKAMSNAKTIAFNKENNFTLSDYFSSGLYLELWSENGAVEIKMNLKQDGYTISYASSTQYSSEFGFTKNDELVEITKTGTNIKDSTDYFITIVLPAANAAYEFEISFGGQTFTINGEAGKTKLKAGQAIQFTPENTVIKITAKAGITEPVSGIRIQLSTT